VQGRCQAIVRTVAAGRGSCDKVRGTAAWRAAGMAAAAMQKPATVLPQYLVAVDLLLVFVVSSARSARLDRYADAQ
jgi:hypothetical protein